MTNHNIVIEKLNEHLAIEGAAHFEEGPGGLIRLVLNARGASAYVYLHGAHVAHYHPAGHEPVLFMSDKSHFAGDQPIRGGVPICFPWFAGKADDPKAPGHGFVRTRGWKVRSLRRHDDGHVTVVLALDWSPRTQEIWPHAFETTMTVRLSDELHMEHFVHNHGRQPFTFEQALHSYFAVKDVRNIEVTGLAGATYLDKVDGLKRKTQSEQPIRITGETDRVYLSTQTACEIHDPGMSRRIRIEKTGSNTSVVWNPWIEKAKKMPDFGDDEWPRMVCIETANAGENKLTLQPDQSHVMTTTIRVSSLT